MEPIEVEPLFQGDKYTTTVWTSAAARKGIRKECDNAQRFMKKLQEVAKSGFHAFAVGENCLFKHESGSVFRFRHSSSSLFRLIGFYHGPDDHEFIAVDAFLKSGQKLSPSQVKRIKWADQLAQNHQWTKKSIR